MSDFLEELDEEFKDDPDYQSLSNEEKRRIVSALEKMMDMGMAAVYGDEDENVPDADVPCDNALGVCNAKCCTFIFALTKDEVKQGLIKHNEEKPFFIARDKDDGYCPHLDRKSLQCEVWDNRPLRCRRYDCRDDKEAWPTGIPTELKA